MKKAKSSNSFSDRTATLLLLNNDARQEVEVQEGKHVDFLKVQEYLAHGGSVFITSKNSQKLLPKEEKAHRNKNKSRKAASLYFNHM